ncbi:hypothetical protein BD410DRAFT_877077 [Rickenella mellea]|uniref:PIN domain-containing protein n=1 Tax=Rickenella mellea TaxID=50990 RepID=A0A4Y7PX83_9AGAM|nr:hypothetical protein BD410DRAFT_877077 [Rickenella mellea]
MRSNVLARPPIVLDRTKHPAPKSSARLFDFIFAYSITSSNFTLSSTTDGSSASSALFREETGGSAFAVQLKKLYRVIKNVEAKALKLHGRLTLRLKSRKNGVNLSQNTNQVGVFAVWNEVVVASMSADFGKPERKGTPRWRFYAAMGFKVQTSKGNYLSTLVVRSEQVEFSDASWGRNMGDLILRAAVWHDGHWANRSAILSANVDERDTTGAAKVVLLSFDRNLRLKARAGQLDAADEKDMAEIFKA